MAKICYVGKKFSRRNLKLISDINEVIEVYEKSNLRPSALKIYKHLVKSELIDESNLSYKRLVSVIGNGRISGLIDWDAIDGRRQVNEADVLL